MGKNPTTALNSQTTKSGEKKNVSWWKINLQYNMLKNKKISGSGWTIDLVIDQNINIWKYRPVVAVTLNFQRIKSLTRFD